ncbi:MAG: HAAS signaling domain-containing protein [Terriglobales bacterium]
MTMPGDAQQRIETYLGTLRQRLRGVKDAEVREIVEELRSHIMDKLAADKLAASGEGTAAGVDAALAALGSPEELASQYITDNLLARAEVSRSPLQILKSLFRWASLSVAGFFVLLGSIVGYFFGVVLMLVAVAKLFHPRTAGLWTYRDSTGDLGLSFRLGFGSAPGTGNDVLGWWIVPIGWLVGCGLVMLTTHIAVWFVRQYRRSLVLP